MAVPPRVNREPLFAVYHEFVEPNPDGNLFLSHNDIIEHAKAAIAYPHIKAYDPDSDMLFFEGMAWKMRDCFYLARKVNTEHPDALDWLTRQGYDIQGAPMGWVVEFIFDNGRALTTAHRYDLRHAPRLKFGTTQFAILDTALINLHRVVHLSSFWANLDLHVNYIQKRTPR